MMRPEHLLAARMAFDRDELQAEELHRIEDEEIRKAVALQEDIGFKVVTDGEFRRESWNRDFLLKFDNVVLGPSRIALAYNTAAAARPSARRPRSRSPARSAAAADLCRAFQVSEIDRAGHAQAHHPLADHPAFSRRPRVDRQGRLSGDGGVLRRRRARLQRGDRATWPRPAAAICRSTT